MNNEKHDPVWQLLGKAKDPEISPYFARNVMREIRALGAQPRGAATFIAWFRHSWKLVSAGSLTTIAAVVVLTVGTITPHTERIASAPAAKATVVQPADYEVISNLDTLVASENNDVWLDTNSY